MNNITMIGISMLALYSVGQLLSFIGINKSVYASYFLFYILLLVSLFILPHDYPTV
jgi:hypothetical protein